jgi:iron complex transport system ATP-binding protein
MQLHVESLSLVVGDTSILSEVSFNLPDKTWMAVLGPNGAGKTSLLRAIAGIVPPTSGRIEVDNETIENYTTKQLAEILGYVPQRIGEVPPFTVEEFLELSVITSRSVNEPIIRSLVDGLREKRLPTLSGGELQRVMIAGALRQSAQVLLLDEPTNNLDPKGVQIVEKAISFLQHATPLSALVVTHDINFALRMTDAITLMRDGRIVWSGKKDDHSFLEALSDVYEVSFTTIKDGNGRSVIWPQEELP